MDYKHRDKDDFGDETICLHDCIVDEISFEGCILRFYFSDGFWITPLHKENKWGKTVRTDAAVMELKNVTEEAVALSVTSPTLFNRRKIKSWQLCDLIEFINSDKGSLEFIGRKVTETQQIWECEIHANKKPYLRACYLYLPKTESIFRWNNLCEQREW